MFNRYGNNFASTVFLKQCCSRIVWKARFQFHGRKLAAFRELECQNIGLDLGPATLYPDPGFLSHVARFGVNFLLGFFLSFKLLADVNLVWFLERWWCQENLYGLRPRRHQHNLLCARAWVNFAGPCRYSTRFDFFVWFASPPRIPSLVYLLTPWSRIILEKLTGFQLVKKFPPFYGSRRFISAFTPPVPILSQLDSSLV
jgi:hypothetical protein